jgi:hypothetical protein
LQRSDTWRQSERDASTNGYINTDVSRSAAACGPRTNGTSPEGTARTPGGDSVLLNSPGGFQCGCKSLSSNWLDCCQSLQSLSSELVFVIVAAVAKLPIITHLCRDLIGPLGSRRRQPGSVRWGRGAPPNAIPLARPTGQRIPIG